MWNVDVAMVNTLSSDGEGEDLGDVGALDPSMNLQTGNIEDEEDTEYADIYIPIPYDPEIPGVRCVDAEEVENVDGDYVELQELVSEFIEDAIFD